MISYVKIDDIKPAEYNPRKISEIQFEHLKESLDLIGCVVPVLVNNQNNVIIAGHQRTKAMRAVGIVDVPVFKIDNIGIGDEIKFNQVHNAIDHRNQKPTILIDSNYEKEDFIEIEANDFSVGDTTATVVKEVCKLIVKYGNVLSCVVCNGTVYLGHNYVKACKLMGIQVNAYICDDNKQELLEQYFSQDYGKYSYDNIKRNTYVQGLAQMFRNVEMKDGIKKQNRSVLYTKVVLPYLQKNDVDSILDFGCGKASYINMLKKKYDAVGLEFYNNNGTAINTTQGNKMVDDVVRHIDNKGLFDVVVCDSVLNSVDSIDAEYAVLKCLNILSKDIVFVSGRTITGVERDYKKNRDGYNGKRFTEYLDDNNFTANYRKGQWYFQHYHTREMLKKSLNDCGLDPEVFYFDKFIATFQVMCRKKRELTLEEKLDAIKFEFNLPLPNGKSYNRHEDIIASLKLGE